MQKDLFRQRAWSAVIARVRHVPLLLISMLVWFTLWKLLHTTPPAALRGAGISSPALVVCALIWIATYSGSAWLFLHTRRGCVCATGVVGLCFLQLQRVPLVSPLGACFVFSLLVAEIVWSWIDRR